jgi:hypothetical protein
VGRAPCPPASSHEVAVIAQRSVSRDFTYAQNGTMDASAIDAIFSQGVIPLSPTDLFDQATPEDLLNLAKLLANLSNLTVVKRKLT